jgi:predicted dehydrogenase
MTRWSAITRTRGRRSALAYGSRSTTATEDDLNRLVHHEPGRYSMPLGTGLIGHFYRRTLHGQRNRDRVQVVYSRTEEGASRFARENDLPEWTTRASSRTPRVGYLVIGLPNHLHEQAVELCAKHGAGGGAIVDLGCHCIEIIRRYMGTDNRPVAVMCWTDTLVHPIEAEDNAIALIRFESGAVGQVEVSWTFRGGMNLRDEVAGTEGTIWTNHFLRTGFEIFTSGEGGYVAEKAETSSGWLFPVGDEVVELGYVDMFTDMFNAMDESLQPMETFYDGYVVNTIIDACYRSAQSQTWGPVELSDSRGKGVAQISKTKREYDGKTVIKEEKMPDGRLKLILKDEDTGGSQTSW